MRSRLVSVFKNDLVFSWRHGFYFVYIALTFGYVLLVKNLPEHFSKYVVPLMVFSDPSLVGMIFAGTIVLLEQQQGTLDYLVITPLRHFEYIISKTITLVLVAIFAGVLITILCLGVHILWFWFLIGIILTSAFHTLLGISLSLGAKTMNSLVMRCVPFILLSTLPALAIFDVPYTAPLKILPGYLGAHLIYGSVNGIVAGDAAVDMLLLAAWCVFLALITAKVFKRSLLGGK